MGAISTQVHPEQEPNHAGAGKEPAPLHESGSSAVSHATLPNFFIQYVPNGNRTLAIPPRCLLIASRYFSRKLRLRRRASMRAHLLLAASLGFRLKCGAARKGGAEGEHGLHALARYLRDETFDLTAALAAFESQRARFPHGSLKVDADRAIIGLLPRLGRYGEALVETQSFLDAQPDAEDRAEIRLLRGDIYRAIYKDAIRAEREYGEGSDGKGRAGDDSRFLHALCLEALGRMNEARRAYRDYLAQPVVAHAQEALRRMDQLSR
jgi:hypothetical protein